jgi:hypothetical protein
MALRPEPLSGDGPAWPVSTLTTGPQMAGPSWPAVDLRDSPGRGVIAPDQAPVGPPDRATRLEEPSRGPAPVAHSGPVASLQARSLGELVSGAVAVGFVFVFAASVVTAFAHIPGQGVRARLLVAFNYANFLTAVALLFGMVCLLLLGRSAARGGLAQVATGRPLRRPAKDVLAATLATEAALVGIGALASFCIYISLASSLPAAGVGHLMAELAVLPVVAVTLLWGWAGGTAKLRALFGVGGPSEGQTEQDRATGPLAPPPVVGPARDREAEPGRQ